MSQATRQAITLLSVVSGSMKLMAQDKQCDPALSGTLMWGMSESSSVTVSYPSTGNERKNIEWSLDKLKRWENYLDSIPETYKFPTLMYVCDHVMTDLTTKINNQTVQYKLAPLTEACKTIIDIVDPDQSMFECMEHADTAINELYSLTGFSRP